MTALNIFKSPKKELAAEREKLDKRWQELAEKESALKAEKTAADIKQRKADEYGRIHNIPIERIVPNPSQPRRQFEDESIIRLADSIRQYGILQPLTVRRMEADELLPLGEQRMEVVAGERRLRAAKILGLRTVPCIIVDVDSRKSAELAIIENIQRENLNIFEQASSIAALIDIYDLTQEEVAKQLSMSQSFVANKLRILRLTAPEREKILAYNLTERHARALLKIDSVEQRLRIIDYIERLLAESDSSRRQRSPRKIVLKDIRIFYNSIDKAVALVRQAGIAVSSERNEVEGGVEVIIRIPNR